MALDEEVLEAVAKDGTMDYEKWPGTVEPLLERLDHIVHNDFPMPKMPPELTQTFTSQQSSFPSSYPSQDASFPTSSNKENAPPTNLQMPPRPNVLSFSDSSERIPDSQQSAPGPADDTLPPPLLLILNSIKSTLRSYFALKPPHTIQRLSELILRPTRHYRTLPAYLRAVDRVVSVSSSADIFPLPQTAYLGDSNTVNGQSNGGSGFMMVDNSLGSDESLGGALLTPIPWLNNAGLEDTRSDPLDEGQVSGTVSQGELIRQEQEAGVATTSQIVTSSGGVETGTSLEADEDTPHARGPPLLGVEDMGLQDGKGVQMMLASETPENGTVASAAEQQGQPEGADDAGEATSGNRDSDGDIVLSDATGRAGQQGIENGTAGRTNQKEGTSRGDSTEQDAEAEQDA